MVLSDRILTESVLQWYLSAATFKYHQWSQINRGHHPANFPAWEINLKVFVLVIPNYYMVGPWFEPQPVHAQPSAARVHSMKSPRQADQWPDLIRPPDISLFYPWTFFFFFLSIYCAHCSAATQRMAIKCIVFLQYLSMCNCAFVCLSVCPKTEQLLIWIDTSC